MRYLSLRHDRMASNGVMLLGIALFWGCATVAAVKPLDPCQERAQDIARVCAHQGRNICDPSAKIVCPGDGVVWFPGTKSKK